MRDFFREFYQTRPKAFRPHQVSFQGRDPPGLREFLREFYRTRLERPRAAGVSTENTRMELDFFVVAVKIKVEFSSIYGLSWVGIFLLSLMEPCHRLGSARGMFVFSLKRGPSVRFKNIRNEEEDEEEEEEEEEEDGLASVFKRQLNKLHIS